jgi:hypothetical protein
VEINVKLAQLKKEVQLTALNVKEIKIKITLENWRIIVSALMDIEMIVEMIIVFNVKVLVAKHVIKLSVFLVLMLYKIHQIIVLVLLDTSWIQKLNYVHLVWMNAPLVQMIIVAQLVSVVKIKIIQE